MGRLWNWSDVYSGRTHKMAQHGEAGIQNIIASLTAVFANTGRFRITTIHKEKIIFKRSPWDVLIFLIARR